MGELTLERMNKCSDALAKKYLLSVRAIYGATENGKPDHIGSCVLLEYHGEKIIVTAAHIIDNNNFTSLYITGESKLVQIVGSCLITAAQNNDRDKDKFDFSVLPISDELASNLGDVFFIPESNWGLHELPAKDRCCLALGFPNSRNKKIDAARNTVKLEPFVYTSTLKSDPKIFEEIKFSMAEHYLLDFCSRHSKDFNNKITNSICPKGVSGGGLFLIEDMANPESYRPEAECSGKFLGILIEQRKNKKVLVFTKISTIEKALTLRSSRPASATLQRSA
ncbi:MAG: hypothetical protein JNM60_03415 [Candidatus Competibacteraceae bacterium]|nr:hypothetical protein [Candidatus Competibacteraceae bacterium]